MVFSINKEMIHMQILSTHKQEIHTSSTVTFVAALIRILNTQMVLDTIIQFRSLTSFHET